MSDIYIGVSNVARNIANMYIGVNNIARKVINGYIGVGGVARKFYPGVPPIPTIQYHSTVTTAASQEAGAISSTPSYVMVAGGQRYTTGVGYTRSEYITAIDSSLTKSSPTVLSTPRAYLKGERVGNHCIFAGGMSSSATQVNAVDSYSNSLSKNTITALSTAMKRLGSARNANYAVFGGGEAGNTPLTTVNLYNASLSRTASTLSTAVFNPAGATVGNYAILAGGQTAVGDNYGTNQVRAWNTSGATTDVSLTTARSQATGARTENYAVFAGGRNTSGNPLYSVECFNSSLVRSAAPDLQYAHITSAGTYFKGCAVIGYQTQGSGYTSHTEAYTNDLVRFVVNGTYTASRELYFNGGETVGDYLIMTNYNVSSTLNSSVIIYV